MRVLVYVEGRSDVLGLQAVLRTLIDAGRNVGVGISFHDLNGKAPVLEDAPRKAADHLHGSPGDWVFALPDLYPMSSYAGTRNAHDSFEALASVMRQRFEARAARQGLAPALHRRFRVHCLKHDLEALLLAAPEVLRTRLGTGDGLHSRWRKPVEDQNDEHPPKTVVADLFRHYRKRQRYLETIDGPWVLQRADLDSVVSACPQRFAPFVGELRAIVDRRELA